MGSKSRGNWKTGVCLKTDCKNRDIRCDICIRFSEYTGNTGEVTKEEPKTPKKLRVSIYKMPLEKYCERAKGNKTHGKGSWPRHVDPNGDDFGKAGCREGKGIWHPMVDGRCKYCGKTKEELEKG